MLLLRLRQETRALHSRAEGAVDIGARLADRRAYAELLIRTLGFYGPLERSLERIDWPSLGLDFAARAKVPSLRTDLRALHIRRDVIDQCALCARLPALDEPARALGCLYVLEGATLGGLFVSRMLATRLRIDAHDGGAFYASYGADRAAMWRAFGEATERHCDSDARRDAAVLAAIETFECFIAWFSPRDVRPEGGTPRSVRPVAQLHVIERR